MQIPSSHCIRQGRPLCRPHAPVGGLHKVFDQALSDLESLLLRTRSLIVIDWRFNREIYAVIRGHVGGSPDGPAAGAPA